MSDYLSKDEISNIVMAFKEMDLKPCAQTPDDFKTWMEDYKDTDDDLWNAYLPRISAFSGDAKTGTPYDLWRYEVQCLIKTGHTHETITMAIRRSLRGDASKVPMRLGPEATIDDIIDKMDSIYGSVDQPEALLGQFYTARQQDDEDVATWACRLEEILSKAKNRKNVTEENINDMLTSKFFDGLRPEMKNIVRYKKDTITDFHSLLKATREIENQHNLKPSLKKKPPTQATSKSTTTTVENRQIQQLTALVKQLSQDVKALKEDRNFDQPSTNIQWSLTELERQHNRLALVKSAETKPIIIQPNTEVVIKGYMDKMLPYPSTVSMLHATSNSVIPYDLDIVQAIITYDQNQRDDIPVHISNISTRTVTVAPRALLCELQPVTITTEQ
ncbi:Hypothetical predicted protein, partial [Mytilus galloprovincialis]